MAIWTMRNIANLLEKVNARNTHETAVRIVDALESRSHVQRMAILVGRRAARWYQPSFHADFDEDRRNTCDNFVKSLVQAFANRSKPIRGVPLPELGLSGAPLLKADLLSVWDMDKGTTGMAPIAAALYNAQCLALDDIQAVLLACLEPAYLQSCKGKHRGDALLVLEAAARDLEHHDPVMLDGAFARIAEVLKAAPQQSETRHVSGKRTIPSLRDRYEFLHAKRSKDWRSSPYGSDAPTPAERSAAFDGTPTDASRMSSHAAGSHPSARQPSESAHAGNIDGAVGRVNDQEDEAYRDDDGEEHGSSMPHTPPSTGNDYTAVARQRSDGLPRKVSDGGPPLLSLIHSQDHGDAPTGMETLPSRHFEDNDGDTTERTASPWTAYFFAASQKQRPNRQPVAKAQQRESPVDDLTMVDDAETHGKDSAKGVAPPKDTQLNDADIDGPALKAAGSAAAYAEMQRKASFSSSAGKYARPLPLPPAPAPADPWEHDPKRFASGGSQIGVNDVHVAFGQALEGGGDYVSPVGASRAPSGVKYMPEYPATKPVVASQPVTFEDDDAIWIDLEPRTARSHAGSSPVRARFPPQLRLGDARRLARLFSTALARSGGDVDEMIRQRTTGTPAASQDAPRPHLHHLNGSVTAATSTKSSPREVAMAPIEFLPSGAVGQALAFGVDGDSDIFIEYAQDMTLAETRLAARRLAAALQEYGKASSGVMSSASRATG